MVAIIIEKVVFVKTLLKKFQFHSIHMDMGYLNSETVFLFKSIA